LGFVDRCPEANEVEKRMIQGGRAVWGTVRAEKPQAAGEASAIDPELQVGMRVLFHARDSMGVTALSFWVMRADFIAANRAAVIDLLEDYMRATRWFLDQQIAPRPSILSRASPSNPRNESPLSCSPPRIFIAAPMYCLILRLCRGISTRSVRSGLSKAACGSPITPSRCCRWRRSGSSKTRFQGWLAVIGAPASRPVIEHPNIESSPTGFSPNTRRLNLSEARVV
jgi:hypothetical protein